MVSALLLAALSAVALLADESAVETEIPLPCRLSGGELENDPADLADQVAVATSSVAVLLVVTVMLQVSIMLSMLLVFFASTIVSVVLIAMAAVRWLWQICCC